MNTNTAATKSLRSLRAAETRALNKLVAATAASNGNRSNAAYLVARAAYQAASSAVVSHPDTVAMLAPFADR